MKIPEKLKKALKKAEKAIQELENIQVQQGDKSYGVDVRNCPLYIYYNQDTDEGVVSDGVQVEWRGEFIMTLKKKVV